MYNLSGFAALATVHNEKCKEKGMRICMLINNDCSSDTRVLREAESLVHAGHSVTILALQSRRDPDLPPQEIAEAGFRIVRLPKQHVHLGSIRGLVGNWLMIQLFQLFVHSGLHSLIPKIGLYLLLIFNHSTPRKATSTAIEKSMDASLRPRAAWRYYGYQLKKLVLVPFLLPVRFFQSIRRLPRMACRYVYHTRAICIVRPVVRLFMKHRPVRHILFLQHKYARALQTHLKQKRRVITRFFRDRCRPILNSQNHYLTFYEAARRQDADVYHVHDLPLLLVGSVVATAINKPLIFDSHELWLERSLRPKTWKRRGAAMLRFLASNFVAKTITVNESLAVEHRVRYGISMPTVIRNCASRVDMCAGETTSYIQGALNLRDDAFIALFHGSFGKLRGLDNLVRAAKHLKGSRAHIVFIGRGPEETLLRSLARELGVTDHVHFLPFVPEPQLMNWVRSAHIGIVAYPNSSLNTFLSSPNKLYQYLMAGLPVVTVDHPEKRRIVLENAVGPVGIVIPEPRPDLIAEAIIRLSEDKELWQELSHNARILCDTELNWEEEARKLIALYEELQQSNKQDTKQQI